MRRKYKIENNKKSFIESKEKLYDKKKELARKTSIDKQLSQSMDMVNSKCIDANTKDSVLGLLNDSLKENHEQQNILAKEIDEIIHDMENVKENITEILHDTKKQRESLSKKELVRKFEEIEEGTQKIDNDIKQLSSLEKSINQEIQNQLQGIDSGLDGEIFVAVPDKEDISWEVEEILNERKTRLEALEEISSGTLEIFETTVEPKETLLDYAHATSDIFTTTVNVATISTALIGEAIKRKISGEKKTNSWDKSTNNKFNFR